MNCHGFDVIKNTKILKVGGQIKPKYHFQRIHNLISLVLMITIY
jgi:hypothetical protein